MILNVLGHRVEILALGWKECSMLNDHFRLNVYRGDDVYTAGHYWVVRGGEVLDIDADELRGPFHSREDAKAAAIENLSY